MLLEPGSGSWAVIEDAEMRKVKTSVRVLIVGMVGGMKLYLTCVM